MLSSEEDLDRTSELIELSPKKSRESYASDVKREQSTSNNNASIDEAMKAEESELEFDEKEDEELLGVIEFPETFVSAVKDKLKLIFHYSSKSIKCWKCNCQFVSEDGVVGKIVRHVFARHFNKACFVCGECETRERRILSHFKRHHPSLDVEFKDQLCQHSVPLKEAFHTCFPVLPQSRARKDADRSTFTLTKEELAQKQEEQRCRMEEPSEYLKEAAAVASFFKSSNLLNCSFLGCKRFDIGNSLGFITQHVEEHLGKPNQQCCVCFQRLGHNGEEHWREKKHVGTPKFRDLRKPEQNTLITLLKTCFPLTKEKAESDYDSQTEDQSETSTLNKTGINRALKELLELKIPRNPDQSSAVIESDLQEPRTFKEELKIALESFPLPAVCGVVGCSVEFSQDYKDFDHHIGSHFGGNRYKCRVCNWELNSNLAEHLKKAHSMSDTSEHFEEINHQDLIKVMRRVLCKQKQKTSLAQPTNDSIDDFPPPKRFLHLVRKAVELGPDDKLSCNFEGCQESLLENVSMERVEQHIVSHFSSSIAQCLGCRDEFRNWKHTERHLCKNILIADKRGQLEEELLDIGKKCFPSVAKLDLDTIIGTLRELPENYLSMLRELVDRLEKGLKLKCKWPRCKYIMGRNKSTERSTERVLEDHILSHVLNDYMRLYQCLVCWKKISSSPQHHLKKWHPIEEEVKVKDLRVLFEQELIHLLQSCFVGEEAEQSLLNQTTQRRGRKPKTKQNTSTTKTEGGMKKEVEEERVNETTAAELESPMEISQNYEESVDEVAEEAKAMNGLDKSKQNLLQAYGGMDKFVDVIGDIYEKQGMACRFPGCKHRVRKSSGLNVVAKHVLLHFPRGYYQCNTCAAFLRYPEQHITVKHGLIHPNPSMYQDLRPQYEEDFIRLAFKCFTNNQQGPEK